MKAIKQNADYDECPNADCSNGCWLSQEDGSIFTCLGCNIDYFVACKVPIHLGESCEAYQARTRASIDSDEQATQKYLKNANVKECPDCGARIRKIDGCHPMTCE